MKDMSGDEWKLRFIKRTDEEAKNDGVNLQPASAWGKPEVIYMMPVIKKYSSKLEFD